MASRSPRSCCDEGTTERVRAPGSIISLKPMIRFSGVRSSWLIAAANCAFRRRAASASRRARSSSRFAGFQPLAGDLQVVRDAHQLPLAVAQRLGLLERLDIAGPGPVERDPRRARRQPADDPAGPDQADGRPAVAVDQAPPRSVSASAAAEATVAPTT